MHVLSSEVPFRLRDEPRLTFHRVETPAYPLFREPQYLLALANAIVPIFTKLGVLRPGCVLRIFWDAAPSLLTHKDQAAPFVATVSWSERSRPRQQVDYRHDLSIYRQLPEALD